jgi:hypothetical protein
MYLECDGSLDVRVYDYRKSIRRADSFENHPCVLGLDLKIFYPVLQHGVDRASILSPNFYACEDCAHRKNSAVIRHERRHDEESTLTHLIRQV